MIDYQKMDEKELNNLIENAEKALRSLQSNKHKKVLAQIKDLAASINVSVEITENESKVSSRKGISVPVKYRHPDDPEKTWTGRGVMPNWLKSELDAGRDRSEFAV